MLPSLCYNVGMPRHIESKPCRKCGTPVEGYRRRDRASYVFPDHCPKCRGRNKGPAHHNWKGGRYKHPTYGYVYVADPTGQKKHVLEHRLVWSKANGPIPKGFQIHHKDGVRDHNDLENLELIVARAHNSMHQKGRDLGYLHNGNRLVGKWSLHYSACLDCQTTTIRHCAKGLCFRCYELQRRPRKPIRWARQFDACIQCQTTERKHICHGLCTLCYERRRGLMRWNKRPR